jgi:hypothetical protein
MKVHFFPLSERHPNTSESALLVDIHSILAHYALLILHECDRTPLSYHTDSTLRKGEEEPMSDHLEEEECHISLKLFSMLPCGGYT